MLEVKFGSSALNTEMIHSSIIYLLTYVQKSHLELLCRKGVLTNFTKFTEKHLCQSLVFNKVAGLRPKACKFIKKESLTQVFSCEFCENSKNTFFYRIPPLAASV